MYPYILTNNLLTIIIDNKQYTISNEHKHFTEIVKMIKSGSFAEIQTLISVKAAIELYSEGLIKIYDNGTLSYNGTLLHNVLTNKIVEMYEQNFPIAYMIKFLENLMLNPSEDARNELYGFLEFGKMPITDDGYFLAYKKVTNEFTDIYTGKIDNSIGSVVKMDRLHVDDNKNSTCSSGLHFCAFNYLKYYGGEHCTTVVILKINPKDVVSIPVDYNNTKGRACEYSVIGIYADGDETKFQNNAVILDDDITKPEPVETIETILFTFDTDNDVAVKPVVAKPKVTPDNISKFNALTPKEKMAYSVVVNYIKSLGNDITEIDLTTLIKTDNTDYDIIIGLLMTDLGKEISRDQAVHYYKVIKRNFGKR